jgi:hypothetical protein
MILADVLMSHCYRPRCAVHSFRFYCLRWSRSWSFAQAEDLERWLRRNRPNDHLHRSAHAKLDAKHINGFIDGSHPFQKNKHTDLKKLWWYWTGLSHFLAASGIFRGDVLPWVGWVSCRVPRSFQDALYPGLGTEPDEGDAAAAGLRQDDWYGGSHQGRCWQVDDSFYSSDLHCIIVTAPVVTPAVVNVRVCGAS